MDSKDSAEIAKAVVDALNKAVKMMKPEREAPKMAGSSVPSNRGQKKDSSVVASAKNFTKLEDAAEGAAKSLSWMTQKVDKASIGLKIFATSIGNANGKLKVKTTTVKATPQKIRSAPSVVEKEDRASLDEIPKNQKSASFSAAFQSATKASDATMAALGVLAGSLKKLGTSTINVVDDAFEVLAARGYGTTESMTTLYKGAINANMSLREYAKFMDNNMIAISRASSFAEFQKNLSIGTSALEKFGVFGEDATQLAGAMMSSSTALGVPQAQLTSAMTEQIAVFGELRKTTNITAESFAALVKQLGEDYQIRTELSALAPADRANRQQELLQQAAYVQSLNLSTSEQQRYTQSILDQRKTTVKQRFQQAGRLSQAAGMLRMSGDQTNELRKLSLKRYKTDEEQQRYQDLLGTINTGLEQMQQSDSPGSQNQADNILDFLTSSGIDFTSAAAIRAAKESGSVKNQDIGKQLDPLTQGIGKLINTLEGWTKNPLGGALVGVTSAIIGIGTSLFVGMPAMAVTMGNIIANKVAAAITGKQIADDFTGPPDKKNKGNEGKRTRVKGGLLGIGLGALAIGGISAFDNSSDAKTQDESTVPQAPTGKERGEEIGQTAGQFIGPLATAVALGLAPFTGGMSLVAAGLIGAAAETVSFFAGGAIGKAVGGWIGEMFDGPKEAIQKNTVETKKNSEEIIKARKAPAPTNTIGASDLSSINANLLQSAVAYRSPVGASIQTGTNQTAQAAVISTPAPQQQKMVNQQPINNDQQDQQAAAAKALGPTSQDQPTDQNSILLQILKILQQTYVVETDQVGLTAQLLKAQNIRPSLPDNQDMLKRALAS